MYTGGNNGSGYYPDNYVIMMLNTGYQLRGFQTYQSKATTNKDGYYLRTTPTSNFRIVLK